MSHTPPLPALAEGIIVIKPPQLPLLQLLLQLQPRLPGPHVPPTQLLLAPAEGTIAPLLPALVGGTIAPLHPALVEGTIALSPQLPLLQLLPQQKGVLLKNHQGAVVPSKGNLVLEEVRYLRFLLQNTETYM